LKALALPTTFNKTTWSLHPAIQLDMLITFVNILILIILERSSNVCVFYFCIFGNKLNLYETTCSSVTQLTESDKDSSLGNQIQPLKSFIVEATSEVLV
jgi:hypothetical protein